MFINKISFLKYLRNFNILNYICCYLILINLLWVILYVYIKFCRVLKLCIVIRYFIFLCVVRDLLIFKVLILDGKMFNFWEMMLK